MPASRLWGRNAVTRRVRAVVVAVAASASALALFFSCGDPSGGPREDRGAPPAGEQAGSPAVSEGADSKPVWDRSPESIAAVGDSITRGFDACSLLSDCPRVSWATGTDPEVPSLAQRLLGNPKGRTWNLARSGAVVAELPEQMARAARYRPELVTVLIGANDACADSADGMTPVAKFRADFVRALRTLRRASPRTQVFVASVPNLKRLWSLGHDHPLASRVWRFGICQSMLSDPRAVHPAAVQRRERVHRRVQAYNAVLEQVCSRDARCRYDGGAVHAYRFTTDELSRWDWFHPGKLGQRRLAEIAYRTVTAVRPPARAR